MDPWSTCQADIKSFVKRNETVVLTFEDNFKPLVRYSLPDSAEYLAILGKRITFIFTKIISFCFFLFAYFTIWLFACMCVILQKPN